MDTDPKFVKTGEIIISGEEPPSFTFISVSKSAPLGAASTSNHNIYIFDTVSEKTVSKFDAYPQLVDPGKGESERCITSMMYNTSSDIILTACGPEVSLFDSRTSQSLGSFDVRSACQYATEAVSASSSCDGCLIGAGTDSGVIIWDVRRAEGTIKHIDIQPETVGSLEFHPLTPSVFLSGDDDGNLLLFDVDEADDEEGTIFYANDVVPVFQCGFCGIDTVFTLRRTAGIRLWDFMNPSEDVTYEDLRPCVENSFDFPVDAHWCGEWLMVVGGDSSGGVALSLVSKDGAKLFHKIPKAHKDCINASHLDVFDDGSIKLYLAGDGGQLSFWKVDGK